MSLRIPLRIAAAAVIATVIASAAGLPSHAAGVKSGSYQCASRDVPGATGVLSLSPADVAPVKPGAQVQLGPASGGFELAANSLPANRGWTTANVYLNPGIEVSGAKVTQGDALQAQLPVTSGGFSYQSSFSFNTFSFDTPGTKELRLPSRFTVNVTFSDAAGVPTNEFFTCSTTTPVLLQAVTVLGAVATPSAGPTSSASPSSSTTPQPSSSSAVSATPAANGEDLPNTGFSGLWWGTAGLALLVLGALALLLSRRRALHRVQETKK
ncbi:LPXTG cell wall anchor domain-containing protein [Psychromicrobium sp. YIM B11713]|uniref:LPXTG cell wall anchor domain-containing protein n=1 Tax=Psychromicrobium sp. YIM B11713 TaxID=3145233 RepID=UPI00374F3612